MYKKNKEVKGYCAVTADILHPGHIRFINICKEHCDYLTVGIMTDECVKKYKKHYPVMNQFMRMEIVRNLKAVDETIFQDSFEFPYIKNTVIFDGEEHNRKRASMCFPYTEWISSSKIKKAIQDGIKL